MFKRVEKNMSMMKREKNITSVQNGISRHKKISKMKKKVLDEINNKLVDAEDKSNGFTDKREELFKMKHVQKKSEKKEENITDLRE